MAQLTWREMSAPQLGTALQGYRQFSDMLNSALGAAGNAINEVDASATERANSEALRAAAAIQDPEKAKSFLTSSGVLDNARLSAGTINALVNRPGALISQALNETNLADVRRTQAQSIAQDALGVDLARGYQLRAAEGAGTLNADQRKELDGINSRIAAAAGAVGSKNTMSNLGVLADAETGGLSRASTRLGMDRTRQDMSQSATRFNWDVTDRADQQAGMRAFMDMQNQSFDRESALAAFTSGQYAKLSPGAKMYALQQLNTSWGNIYQPEDLASMSGFSGSGGGAGSGMDVMNYQARGAGFGAVPSSIKTMGDASSYADRVNAAGVPSSAMGPYQIVGNTRDGYAKKLFGDNWRSQPYSVENETRIATAIFNDNKGSADALRRQWVSLSPAEAERVRKMPAQQALAYIAQKESGASASSLFGTQAGAALRVGQDREGKSSATSLIQAAANGPSNPLDVVDQLRAGRFAGTSREFVKSQLDDIVRRGQGNITYSQAGVILNDALRENNNSWGVTNYLSGNSVRVNKAGDRINGQYITNEIERARKGGLVADAVREQDVQTSLGSMATAQSNLARAQAAYQGALRRQAVQPAIAAQLPRLKAQLDAAQAAVINAQGGVERIAAPRSAQTQPAGQQSRGGSFWDELSGLFTIHRGS